MKRALLIVMALTLSAGRAHAAFSSGDKGTTTANFLKLGVGARGEAMGEAYTAMADDATALYWNPAGITLLPDGSVSATAMHAPYLSPSYYDFMGFVKSFGDGGAVGTSIQYFSGGSINQTDINDAPMGTLSPYDVAASMTYAQSVEDFAMGLSVKYIHSHLIASANTGAIDFGLSTPRFFDDRLRLAFVMTNLGGRMTFEQESFGLPLDLKFGSAYRLTSNWDMTFDVNFPVDNSPYSAVGTEYRWKMSPTWTIAGRAGYNARSAGEIAGVYGFTGGFGADFQRYSIDYALVPLGQLGVTQRLSLSLKFGPLPAPSTLKTASAAQATDPTTDDLPLSDTFSKQ